ncbi:MAG: DUF4041 domain-containing protein [Actinobacteria bacterium]|nr:DUF4041 domain-containing protein [Actinomycetota bacterium]
MFGTKKKEIQALSAEGAELRQQIGQIEQIKAAQAVQIQHMQAELQRLGALDHQQRQAEYANLKAALASEQQAFERQRAGQRRSLEAEQASHDQMVAQRKQELAELAQQLIPFTEEAVFQDAGIFRYHHPLDNAEAYKDRLAAIQTQMKEMARTGEAAKSSISFTYNNSVTQGRRLAKDLSKLMLRAYNAEAENCLRVMRAGSVDVAKRRLDKTADAIEKLGKIIDLSISPSYRRLREQELELTADYLRKKDEEKEAARAERELLREQAKLEAEIQREVDRLEKERNHRRIVLESLIQQGRHDEAEQQRSQISDIDASIEGLHSRKANVRAGYVYVISNVGAFGPGVVKIGLTRRLDPRERITELGDASVPFRYDTHVLFFSDDAVGIENALHRELAARRVNQVNLRREFFYATPQEVRTLLRKHAGDILEFAEEPEASEFYQSRPARDAAGALATPPVVVR